MSDADLNKLRDDYRVKRQWQRIVVDVVRENPDSVQSHIVGLARQIADVRGIDTTDPRRPQFALHRAVRKGLIDKTKRDGHRSPARYRLSALEEERQWFRRAEWERSTIRSEREVTP